ncbi:hypothetical protein FOZG_12860 [Fusarium oxysporum Fo47]|uniref:Uncharacterized protein n=1 Tax=Fusarium oxysporum Fo47 TaxID=660027 RepID=W9JM78_FUSOX|nr:hypothetical protein FOZG_12860 [Fusarium oxysporum Fo47]
MLWNKFIEAAMFISLNKSSASQPFFVDLARQTTNIKVFCNKAVSNYTKSARQIVASASITHLKQGRNLQFLELSLQQRKCKICRFSEVNKVWSIRGSGRFL